MHLPTEVNGIDFEVNNFGSTHLFCMQKFPTELATYVPYSAKLWQ